MTERIATVTRNTQETQIVAAWHLDGGGVSRLSTGIGFFDHMLDQIARHGLFDLQVQLTGDQHIDDHHSVEDTGIVLGQAFRQALGPVVGVFRYGHAYAPLDEALARVVVDISGRPGLFYRADYPRATIGRFDVDLVREFFQGFVNHAAITVHMDLLHVTNTHHGVECLFKAFGQALRRAVTIDPRRVGAPSTKGVL